MTIGDRFSSFGDNPAAGGTRTLPLPGRLGLRGKVPGPNGAGHLNEMSAYADSGKVFNVSLLGRWYWRYTHRPFDWQLECPDLAVPPSIVRRVWPNPEPRIRPVRGMEVRQTNLPHSPHLLQERNGVREEEE